MTEQQTARWRCRREDRIREEHLEDNLSCVWRGTRQLKEKVYKNVVRIYGDGR